MSWLISRALMEGYESSRCLPEPVAEYLVGNCSDGEQSVPLSTNPIPHAYLPSDKMTAFSRLSRFGMTFGHLTESRGEELLTWYLAGFPAKTYQSQEKEPGLTESDLECGEKWPASLAKYDQDSRSWKTAQLSLLADSDEFSETWPKWGSMRNGECWERMTLAPHIGEKESGYWPTPVAQDDNKTPEAHMAMKARMKGGPRHKPTSLNVMVKGVERGIWPTPTVCGNHNRKGLSKTSGDGLATAVAKIWPTATATAYKGWSPNHNRAQTDDRLDYTVERESFKDGQKTPPKRLNPVWVEWLMGFPQGWTDLKPLVTHKCHSVPPKHGES